MKQNNRNYRYRDQDQTSNYNPDRNYNDWDENYNNRNRSSNELNDDYRGTYSGNRDFYSSESDRESWRDRNDQWNDISDNDRSYNRPNSSYMYNDRNFNNNRSNYPYGGGNYGNRYRNEGWRDNYRNEDRDWWDRTKDEVSSWFGDDDARRRRRMDEYREGQHRGKGPKNYSRSPERIKEDVSDKLSEDSMVDASNIEIDVKGNEVTLSGTVGSRYEKRRAEDIAENISGVTNVQNNLRVSSSTGMSGANSTTDFGTNSYSANKNK